MDQVQGKALHSNSGVFRSKFQALSGADQMGGTGRSGSHAKFKDPVNLWKGLQLGTKSGCCKPYCLTNLNYMSACAVL